MTRGGVDDDLGRALERALGSAPLDLGHVRGRFTGTVRLRNGRDVFLKCDDGAPAGLFAAEARGLAWLAAAGALPTPAVLAVAGAETAGPRFLVLDALPRTPPAADHDERLGRGLALLHRAGAHALGLDHDNWIAALPQSNAPLDDWPEFWRRRRLEPLLARARARGLTAAIETPFARVLARLESLCGPPEPPARLHGDLWRGNVIVDRDGGPMLIDPAVYGGHREVDLAMMRLFGGFGERTFRAYEEVFPLAACHAERVALWQLQPLLVHLVLFGGSYVAPLERALAKLV